MVGGNREGIKRKRTASTRSLVEAAIDLSIGAKQEPWEVYISSMTGSIVPWREGSLSLQRRSTRESTSDIDEIPEA